MEDMVAADMVADMADMEAEAMGDMEDMEEVIISQSLMK